MREKKKNFTQITDLISRLFSFSFKKKKSKICTAWLLIKNKYLINMDPNTNDFNCNPNIFNKQ